MRHLHTLGEEAGRYMLYVTEFLKHLYALLLAGPAARWLAGTPTPFLENWQLTSFSEVGELLDETSNRHTAAKEFCRDNLNQFQDRGNYAHIVESWL
jgi:hypothetical protein